MAELPVVELTGEQLHALCLAVAWSVEDEHPAPELASVRLLLESVEERLLSAWADLLLARWDASGPGVPDGTGVA
jgi:hypothetical protein